MVRGRQRRWGAWLALVTLAAGCWSGRFGGSGPVPGPPLQLAAPDPVQWPSAGPRSIEVRIVNAGREPLLVAAPLPDTLGALVRRAGPDAAIACRLDPRPPPAQADQLRLAPGEAQSVTIDLSAACGRLAPGDYRYEVTFVPPPVLGAEGSFAGKVLPAEGTIRVSPEAGLALPAEPGAVSPPAHPELRGEARRRPPLAAVDAETAACVDSELARRGMNAYGDPPGAAYPAGPPAPDGQRIAFILARYPDIRTACTIGRR